MRRSSISYRIQQLLRTSEETGGEDTLIEVEVAPGGGNTPHYHKAYDEHFEVLEGALEVRLGKDTHTLHSGQRAVAAMNTLHSFHDPTDEPVTFLVELRPGISGFEKALEVGYGLARDGRTLFDWTLKNPYHLAMRLDCEEEMRMSGIFSVVEPLFRLLARLAPRKGIDKELEKTYCR